MVPTKPRRGFGVPTISLDGGRTGGCRAMEIWELGAVELAAALRDRELSAVEALEAVLERADAITPTLNPFALRLDERARARRLPRPTNSSPAAPAARCAACRSRSRTRTTSRPVGPARRHQRRRTGGRARVRRPPRARPRIRDHAGPALPARDLRHGRAGRDDACPAAGPRAVQRHAGRRARHAATVFVGPDRAARVVRRPSPPTTRSTSTWPDMRSDAQRRAPLTGSSAITRPRVPQAPALRDRVQPAASARSTPPSTAPRTAPSATAGRADELGAVAGRLYAGSRTVRLRERADRHVGAGPR